MPNELAALRDGFPVSFALSIANPAAAATTALQAFQGASGFVVPVGYVFHATGVMASSNAVLAAGTATFNVTDNASAIANGPSVVLAVGTQQASGLQRVGASPIVAGHIVGVQVVANAGYLPVTLDHDVTLIGVLTTP